MSAIDGVLAGLKMRRDDGRQALDDRERADDLAAKQEERAYQRSERGRALETRARMAAAAAPDTVEDAPVAMPIGSRDEPRPPEDVGIRAAGRTFTSRADADKASAEYNAPGARMTRQADVLDQAGDPMAAQNLRTTMRQGQLADLNLKTAEGAADRDKKLRELGGELIKGGWSAVPAVYDRYNDGHSAQVIEDGKGGATVVKIGPAGDEVGRKQFASLPEFFAGVAGQFDPTLWLARQDKQTETTRAQGNLDREYTRRTGESDRDFQLRKDEAARKAKHDTAMLANDSARVGIARMAATSKAAGQEPVAATAEGTFDRKTASDIAKDQVQKEADEARTNGKVWTAQQIAQRTDAIVQAQLQQHTSRFIESAASRALARAQSDPAAYAAAFEQAQTLGLPLKRLGELGFKPPQRAGAPGQPAAPGAVPAMPAAPVSGMPASPAAAQAGPAAAAPVPFQQFVAQNIATPAGKQEISRRVMKELPEIQLRIKGITDVMALPMVSGAVKAKLKGQLDALAQDAEMMQTFASGNPGI